MRNAFIGMAIVTTIAIVDNFRVGKKYEKEKKLAELLMVQNQTYHKMIMGLAEPQLDVDAYIQMLIEQLAYVQMVAGQDETAPEP